MSINLETIIFPPPKDNTAEIMRQVDYKNSSQEYKQKTGLVTNGFMEVIYTSGGTSWGISDLITFSYEYIEKPIFTWGLEGSYSGDTTNTPASTYNYSPELPADLQAYVDAEDWTTFSPAIFIPRIIHWYRRNELVYSGCFLLVHQINPDCTEIADKICRIHFRFEGIGYISKSLASGV